MFIINLDFKKIILNFIYKLESQHVSSPHIQNMIKGNEAAQKVFRLVTSSGDEHPACSCFSNVLKDA